MSSDSRDLVTWILGTIVTVGVIVGVAVRLILLPYLREHLVKPVREVKKQVTENHHTNDKPTILDRLDDLESKIDTNALEVGGLTRVLDGHLSSGERWMELYDRELGVVKDRVAMLERRRGDDPGKTEAGPL